MNVLRESSILDGILQTTTKKVTKLCPAHLLPDSIPPAPQSTLDEDNAQPTTPLDEDNAQPTTPLDENNAQPPTAQSSLDGETAKLFSSPSTQQGSQTSLLPPPPAEILQHIPPIDVLQTIPPIDVLQTILQSISYSLVLQLMYCRLSSSR